MIEVSWGELAVMTGLGLFLIGKHDLPKAAHVVGTYTGRMVGLLQGARARADRFAAHSELKQLQNELRSGLRELDVVKSELAVSMSPGAMVGRNLGALTGNVNNNNKRQNYKPAQQQQQQSQQLTARNLPSYSVSSSLSTDVDISATAMDGYNQNRSSASASSFLAPSEQTVAAVAEQEWASQGISFVSKAERGRNHSSSFGNNTDNNTETGGSVILANLLQQSLVFDQYDRVVAEQDAILQNKMQETMERVQRKSKASDTNDKEQQQLDSNNKSNDKKE
jgi:Sec-independent protein translocase protein TatA